VTTAEFRDPTVLTNVLKRFLWTSVAAGVADITSTLLEMSFLQGLQSGLRSADGTTKPVARMEVRQEAGAISW
jgi:hypothetical protein